MSKEFVIDDDVYNVLLKYFDGDIINLDKKVLSGLKKGKYKKKDIEPIDGKLYKLLRKIIKLEEEAPEVYAEMIWVYPEKEEDAPEEEEEIIDEEKEDVEVEEISEKDLYKSIIPQRKAFIDWVNNVFYKEVLDSYKNRDQDEEEIKIYQYFVKKYLSIEAPLRGLLIYHGLGTGKTATSVITAEGLSLKMPIYTFLPASLETEYMKEVKSWGSNLFKVEKNNWIFYPLDEIKSNLTLRRKLKKDFGIDEEGINIIFNRTKQKLKNKLDEDDPEYSKNLAIITKKLNDIKGLYIPSGPLKDVYRDIYTYDGNVIQDETNKLPSDREINIINMSNQDELSFYLDYIEEEINILIKVKYNFIHYNGFPKVEDFDFKNNRGKVLDKEKLTDNDKMVLTFAEKYKENYEDHGILSPFRNNVIIIDEVHNFVREIINESVPANIFYNWIVDAEDIKIVFLSGTPVINKPAEIAILFNMLRGSLLVFDFTVKSDRDEVEIQQELRKHFYTENSSIEQINTSKKKGKIIISFTKTKTNFESIMEDDIIKTIKYNNHDLDSFFNEIFDGLYKFFDEKDVSPMKTELLSKSPYKEMKMGSKQEVFDKDIEIPFNRKHKLFEVLQDDEVIDLSSNENFIEYFLDDSYNISPKKKVFLRRMILGLTSYYPIDRKSIKFMPQVVKPREIVPIYKNYSIVKKTNIVLCPMGPIQWANYENEYGREKMRRLNNLRKKDLYNDDQNSDYSIRTRQSCNIVYDDDSFRKGDDEEQKYRTYERMRQNGNFSFDGKLNLYAPKFYKILENINLFVDGENPTGKALYYSDFRKDSGSEAFEQILLENGYEKYEHNKKDINTLISEGSKKKRYTFLTGEEEQELRKYNKEAFNHDENVRGEYIQIILISSAGAEGISLKCVRQVHIMEPFWNYIRIDQVFGRAIRMKSHINEFLPKEERNVEQYLYLSSLPNGNTVEEVFNQLKRENWPDVEGIENDENIKMILLEKHKPVYKTITKILSMKKETNDRSVDQLLFDIMERKNIISTNITDIIKESSVDCIQNSRDDLQLNNKCLRFSSKLIGEESHFPGINSSELNKIDVKQFKSNFLQYIKPNIYVILAKKKEDDSDLYIYYSLEKTTDEIDVRYVRENGLQVCDFDPKNRFFTYYELKDHPLNDKLGGIFSVFKTIYKVTPELFNKLRKLDFPPIKDFKKEKNIVGHIIKYNVTEKLYFSPITQSSLVKLYEFKNYKYNNYSTKGLNYIIMRNNKLFKSID
jgi:phage tail tube protein FII